MLKSDIITKIKLNNGTSIPQLGLGVWLIPDGEQTENSVMWALQAGYRHIDTAKIYKNESSVGRAIKNSGIKREDIWVTTKLWPTDFFNPKKGLEESLNKLDMDYVDLYLLHWPVLGMTNKVWKSMEQLANEKMTKSIGVSNYSSTLIKKILADCTIPPAVNQINCSPFDYPKYLHEFCIENNIAFEAYSPLTTGSRLDDPTLVNIGQRHKKSPAQVLLRWAIQKQMIVIPKSVNKEHINENTKIYDFNLSQSDISLLDDLSS